MQSPQTTETRHGVPQNLLSILSICIQANFNSVELLVYGRCSPRSSQLHLISGVRGQVAPSTHFDGFGVNQSCHPTPTFGELQFPARRTAFTLRLGQS